MNDVTFSPDMLVVPYATEAAPAAFRSISLHQPAAATALALAGVQNAEQLESLEQLAGWAPSLRADVANKWHSQGWQDQAVMALLSNGTPYRDGYFVDLAANDPVHLSNTRALERDFSWQGLCIDGSIGLLTALARHRRCTVVGAVVGGNSSGIVTFRELRTPQEGKASCAPLSALRIARRYMFEPPPAECTRVPHTLQGCTGSLVWYRTTFQQT